MEYSPRGEKKFAPFSLFVFWGVHFNAFVVLQHGMNAVSVCITEIQRLRCILFTFSIMSQNFYWSKKWYEFIVNKNTTRCNSMQIFIYCIVTLHVSGVTAPIIRNRPRWREVAVPILRPVPEAAVTVFSTPDDRCCDTRNM